MPTTEVAGGTLTAVVGSTAQQLGGAQTAAGVYSLKVDLSNMAAGDKVTISVRVNARAGGTVREVFSGRFAHGQQSPIALSDPVELYQGEQAEFYLTQTAGSARSFVWSVAQTTGGGSIGGGVSATFALDTPATTTWGSTASMTMTDQPKHIEATLTASTQTALSVAGALPTRWAVVVVRQPSSVGNGTLSIDGDVVAVDKTPDATTVLLLVGANAGSVDVLGGPGGSGNEVLIGDNAPTSLKQGQLYVETEAGTRVVAMWLGTAVLASPRKIIDATPDLFQTTTGTLPDPLDVVEPALAIDRSTSPWTLKAFGGGAWQPVGSSGGSSAPRINVRWEFTGTAVVGATSTPFYVPFAGTIARTWFQALTGPSGGSLVVDLERSTNGGSTWASLFPTNPSNRPSVAPSGHVSALKVPDTVAVSAGDALRSKIVTVGTADPVAPTSVAFDTVAVTAAASISVPRHPSALQNDVQTIWLYLTNTTATIAADDASWVLRTGAPPSNGTGRVFTFTRAMGDPATDTGPWTFTITGTVPGSVTLRRHVTRGVDLASPIAGSVFGVKSGSGAWPALTTTAAPSLELLHAQFGFGTTYQEDIATRGYTSLIGFNTATPATSSSVHAAYQARSGNLTADTYTPPFSPTGSASTSRIAFKGAAAGAAEPGQNLSAFAELVGT